MFTREEAIRLCELAAYEASGSFWGCTLIALKVVGHYDDEDGRVKSYVSDPDSGIEIDEVDLS